MHSALPRKQTRAQRVYFRVGNLFCFPQKEKPMARVKRGTKRRARRKKYVQADKGLFSHQSKLYVRAGSGPSRRSLCKRDRRVKKREYRKLWIQRVGPRTEQRPDYGQLIHGLKAAGVTLDAKSSRTSRSKTRGIHVARGHRQSRRPASSQGEKA